MTRIRIAAWPLVVCTALLLAPPANAQEIHSALCLYGCPFGSPQTSDLIIRDIYILSSNGDTKFADWAAYRITASTIGSSKERIWRADPRLTPEETLEPEDYEAANAALQIDRGHRVCQKGKRRMKSAADILLEGLCFAEAPRWRDGRLWFADMQAFAVRTVDLAGRSEIKLKIAHPTSGLGWLPDGRLLVVSMTDQKVLRREKGGLVVHADLSGHTKSEINDMITLPNGRSYVGNFGYDIRAGEPLTPTVLSRVESDGSVHIAATDMYFPNGMAVTADGKTLLVAETRGPRITAFDMAGDGTLHNRRVWAELDATTMPDGIALDAEGGLWACSPRGAVAFRALEGGRITHRVKVSGYAIACAFGGPKGYDLLLCSTKSLDVPACRAQRPACIEHVTTDIPGLGFN